MRCLQRGVVLESGVHLTFSFKVKGLMHCLKRRVVLESGVHLTVTLSFNVKGLICIVLKEGWSLSQVYILHSALK